MPHEERGFGQLPVTNLSMYIDNKYLFIQDFLLKEFYVSYSSAYLKNCLFNVLNTSRENFYRLGRILKWT